MSEKPIIFSGEMVNAILGGRKTQTRRLVKNLGVWVDGCMSMAKPEFNDFGDEAWIWPDGTTVNCPYGVIGDALWVRETWAPDMLIRRGTKPTPDMGVIWKASDDILPNQHRFGGRWNPPIFMPHWASRLTLRITDVRAERLQDISEEDAMAEGIPNRPREEGPVGEYADLWDSINAKRAPWKSNPLVWVLTFEVAK